MKHDTNFQPDRQPTALEYKMAIYAELQRDRRVNSDEPIIPVRILSLIDRAFIRANAGEFQ